MTLTTTLICMAIITIAFVRCCKMAIGTNKTEEEVTDTKVQKNCQHKYRWIYTGKTKKTVNSAFPETEYLLSVNYAIKKLQ